jgi:thioredoxin reductase (NADPH)
MFPVLELQEIERVRRFGDVRSYKAGEPLAKVGDIGHGLIIILAGHVDITEHDQSGRRTPIVTVWPRLFHWESSPNWQASVLWSMLTRRRQLRP